MGLDMYAYKTKVAPESKVNFRDNRLIDDDGEELDVPRYEVEALTHWSKHPDLHWWMTELYEDSGGECDIDLGNGFNLKSVELDLDDLDRLERDIINDRLPDNDGRGFFFGESQYPEHNEETLKFIELARQAIADGYYVYYRAWY